MEYHYEHNLPIHQWEVVLPDALHSIRSLISTATNCTPHERLFNYQRKTSSGVSLPSWLSSPGPVLLRRHVRQSKYEPLVDEVELIEANPQYAHIRFPDGREDTVNLRDLAPYPSYSATDAPEQVSDNVDSISPEREVEPIVPVDSAGNSFRSLEPDVNHFNSIEHSDIPVVSDSVNVGSAHNIGDNIVGSTDNVSVDVGSTDNIRAPIRRSQRIRKAPDRFSPD